MMPPRGGARAVIAEIRPVVACGRFPAKRCVGDVVDVEAEVFVDGHDAVTAVIRHRRCDATEPWAETWMKPPSPGLDTWHGTFRCEELGIYEFTVVAWVNQVETWRRGLLKRYEAGLDIEAEVEIGARLIETMAPSRSRRKGDNQPHPLAERLRRASREEIAEIVLSPDIETFARQQPAKQQITEGQVQRIVVEPVIARSSAWYEFFPRSTGEDGQHGTFETSMPMLEYVAEGGFDVVYLPPIHPIGRKNRKGPNNALTAGQSDYGSPWAIGSEEGGHRAINPLLGDFDDFHRFLARARELGLEIALDLAFQCAPDHPLIKEHPEWFRWRPDGTIAYAENPPKRYEDIVPFDFECEDWRGLWQELYETTLFWVENGIRVFRVDNPHTKPFAFWEWMIREIKAEHPEVIFLAEAFTRPALLHGLAMRGFSQSYNYFPWRNGRREIEQYLTELITPPTPDYLRPNLWANTPDILTEHLQHGGRPAFASRFVLAATLGASYGVYGPAFELSENLPRNQGSEEYLDSEKYQLRSWDLGSEWSLMPMMKLVNQIRREHPALQDNRSLRFHETESEALICYSKITEDDAVIVVVNIDPHYRQSGFASIDFPSLGIDEPSGQYQVQDLLGGGRYTWQNGRNFVQLDPGTAHILVPRRKVKTERDFDYYL